MSHLPGEGVLSQRLLHLAEKVSQALQLVLYLDDVEYVYNLR